jgi:hypothetical protein
VRQLHFLPLNPSHRRFPEEVHAQPFRFTQNYPMQNWPANPDSLPSPKICRYLRPTAEKLDAPKRVTLTNRKFDAQLSQRCLRLRLHPFSARFVDRRLGPIRHRHG